MACEHVPRTPNSPASLIFVEGYCWLLVASSCPRDALGLGWVTIGHCLSDHRNCKTDSVAFQPFAALRDKDEPM